MPQTLADTLRERGWEFYQFIGEGGIRLMCSWDTTEADVDAFLEDVRALTGRNC